jgi:hypothetical protein
MCYNTVSIIILLFIPYFSLYCTPLQAVKGKEIPFKHILQPKKNYIFWANTGLPFQLVLQQSRITYSKHKALWVSIQHISQPLV